MWNCLIFFPGWILIRFTLHSSRFVLNSVEILTWNFREKLFWENFSEIFVQTKAIHNRNLRNFALLFALLFLVRIALKKFTQVLPYVFSIQVRRHVHKRITKRRYVEEKSGRFVFGKPILFTLGLRLTTLYSLGVLVWNLYQTFITVCIEFWLRFEPQIHCTRLPISFLLINARTEGKVRSCVKLFDFFRGWILIRLSWNFSLFVPNLVEILTWNVRKKLFRERFSEVFA